MLKDAKRVVVKVGSALVTNDGRGLDVAAIGLPKSQRCRKWAKK